MNKNDKIEARKVSFAMFKVFSAYLNTNLCKFIRIYANLYKYLGFIQFFGIYPNFGDLCNFVEFMQIF